MLPHLQMGIEESGQYTSELVSYRAERSEVSRIALQMFPFSTDFHSLFPISHSLVFHLISSQFPSSTLSHIHLDPCNLPFSPSTIWWLTETRLFRSEKCLQVKSSCWQPLPANPIYLDGAWALHLGRPRVGQTHTFGIWCSVLHNSIQTAVVSSPVQAPEAIASPYPLLCVLEAQSGFILRWKCVFWIVRRPMSEDTSWKGGENRAAEALR